MIVTDALSAWSPLGRLTEQRVTKSSRLLIENTVAHKEVVIDHSRVKLSTLRDLPSLGTSRSIAQESQREKRCDAFSRSAWDIWV